MHTCEATRFFAQAVALLKPILSFIARSDALAVPHALRVHATCACLLNRRPEKTQVCVCVCVCVCLYRFAQMMWRLNFLVFFACVVLNNSYMLYYICPMHTLFTVMVYGCLGIAYHLNQSRAWLLFK